MNTDPAFLATLKEGDRAILYAPGTAWHRGGKQVVTVRITPTQVVANGVRFRKSDGRIIGEGDYRFFQLAPYTEEELLAIRRQRLNADILHMMRSALPEEVAQLSDEEAAQLEEALRKAGLSKGRFEGRHQ